MPRIIEMRKNISVLATAKAASKLSSRSIAMYTTVSTSIRKIDNRLVALVPVMNTTCRNTEPSMKTALVTAIDPSLLSCR